MAGVPPQGRISDPYAALSAIVLRQTFPNQVHPVVAVLTGKGDDITVLEALIGWGIRHAVGLPAALDAGDRIGDIG